jgi:hypothetical protein
MNETIVPHVIATLRRQLQQAAQTAVNSTALLAIARAMANVEAAPVLVRQARITVVDHYPDGSPKTLVIPSMNGSITTTIGCPAANQPWRCTCDDTVAYQSACVHKLAGRLLAAQWHHTMWSQERRERQAALAEAFEAEATALRHVAAMKVLYDAALAVSDRACVARIDAQQAVWRDDAEAVAWGLDDRDDHDPDDDPVVSAVVRVAA